MNKKILLVSILSILMLVTISFASAINTENLNEVKNKESPLFKIRTRSAIGEKIGHIIKNIKAKFIGERIFFLPFQWLRSLNPNDYRNPNTYEKTNGYCTCSVEYCDTEWQVCGKDG
ncbi:MAG TPA: hypothetical protein VGB37_03955 [Candidatus Lokiarchaeia archaeon]